MMKKNIYSNGLKSFIDGAAEKIDGYVMGRVDYVEPGLIVHQLWD